MAVDLDPIFEALNANPGSIAAWEVDEVDSPRLSVFDVTETPRQLVFVSPPQPERKGMTEQLVAAGHPTGYYAAETGVVWRNGPKAFEVWAADGTGLRATSEALLLGDGTPLDRDKVTAIVPFTDKDDVARGVRLRLGETEHTIAIAFKFLAEYLVDFADGKGWKFIGWVSFVAHQLSRWLGVPIMATP